MSTNQAAGAKKQAARAAKKKITPSKDAPVKAKRGEGQRVRIIITKENMERWDSNKFEFIVQVR